LALERQSLTTQWANPLPAAAQLFSECIPAFLRLHVNLGGLRSFYRHVKSNEDLALESTFLREGAMEPAYRVEVNT
jgi:hypothetical protein